MQKSFRYCVYPTKAQTTKMVRTLDECRWLYNHLLEQRKTNWETSQKSLSMYDQIDTLPTLKEEHPTLSYVYAQVLQNVTVRIDLAFKAFFRRVKKGEAPGYPRFRGKERYDSFTYPQFGFRLVNNILSLSKIGNVKLKLHRPVIGKIKTCCVRRTPTGKWFVTFSCEYEPKILPTSSEQVGIDVGLTTFATFSTSETIKNPRFFRKEEKELAKAQRKLTKETKGTKLRDKRRKVVARIYERISNKRRNFAHQESRKIVNRYGTIAVEDITINRMVHKRCVSKSIMDVAWGEFFNYLTYKAEDAGRTVVKVNPAYTSQTCHKCGHRQEMPLSTRTFTCRCCTSVCDRDLNAAKNILALGLQSIRTKL